MDYYVVSVRATNKDLLKIKVKDVLTGAGLLPIGPNYGLYLAAGEEGKAAIETLEGMQGMHGGALLVMALPVELGGRGRAVVGMYVDRILHAAQEAADEANNRGMLLRAIPALEQALRYAEDYAELCNIPLCVPARDSLSWAYVQLAKDALARPGERVRSCPAADCSCDGNGHLTCLLRDFPDAVQFYKANRVIAWQRGRGDGAIPVLAQEVVRVDYGRVRITFLYPPTDALRTAMGGGLREFVHGPQYHGPLTGDIRRLLPEWWNGVGGKCTSF